MISFTALAPLHLSSDWAPVAELLVGSPVRGEKKQEAIFQKLIKEKNEKQNIPSYLSTGLVYFLSLEVWKSALLEPTCSVNFNLIQK